MIFQSIKKLIKRFKSDLESVVDENRTDSGSLKYKKIEVNIQGYVRLTGFAGMEYEIMPYVWKEKGEVIVVNKYGNALPISLTHAEIIGEDKQKRKRAMVSDKAVDDISEAFEKKTDEAIRLIGRSTGF